MEGRDAVSEIPDDRWDKRHFFHPDADEAGRAYTFRAGTLGDVAGFDAAFFGISPREAEQMDPQQRLLLELTWEAMESAGLTAERLAGSDTAVYVGVSSTDYADYRQGDPSGANAYFMLGSTLSIVANRLSYVFDLHGPSMAVDTACSSSLVALHEAVGAIRSGRCAQAVVGGVHLLLSPFPFVGFSKASMLSSYGRCRAFDRIAKGYVRGEGGGALILKPLAQAERDGDPILAVIEGVGLNSDGRTQGIALPSSERQEELLRKVYADCGANPSDLVYFEAHGTGTAVGDPAETGAIGRALSQRRPSGLPLPIGSVKSNIGHLEPASGMAGLIKAIGVLRHGVIPPTLHVDEPNPDIDFDGLNLAVATAARPVARGDRPALVGVNSFGFGGANAHVVLREYRVDTETVPASAAPAVLPPLPISARSPAALSAMAGDLADLLAGKTAPSVADLAWTLCHKRTHHSQRLMVRAATATALIDDLRQLADGKSPSGCIRNKTVSANPRVGFLFSGNGAQWLGMGVQLLAEDAAFRAEVERIDALIQSQAGWSVIAELQAPAETSRIDDTRFSQPMLFAVQAGLVAALAARGLGADAVAGHSVGEVIAAYAAGILTLEQAVHVIVCRSAVQGETRGMGRMAAVALGAQAARDAIAAYDGAIEVAAVNSPSAVTLSGREDALLALKDELGAKGVDFRLLNLDYAFHNRVLDPFQSRMLDSLGAVTAAEGRLRFYSSVTGAVIGGPHLDSQYWWENVRRPVLFQQAVEAMLADGIDVLVEISPHPIIHSYLRHIFRSLDAQAQALGSVNRQNAGAHRLDRVVDEAWTLGADLAWDRVVPAGRQVDLPTYPWQRERFWCPPTPESRGPLYHRWEARFLGARVAPSLPIWESTIDTGTLPFLADHQVGGLAVFPAAGFVEMALQASQCLWGDGQHDVEQLEIRRPLTLDRTKVVRFLWGEDQGTFQISSRPRMTDDGWTVHAVGRLTQSAATQPSVPPQLAADGAEIAAADHYAMADRIGLAYGPAFQTVTRTRVHGAVAVADLRFPTADEGGDGYLLPPGLFDGCLQVVFDLLKDHIQSASQPHAFLPVQIGRLLLHGDASRISRCHVRLDRMSRRSLVASIWLTDQDGAVIAEARSCRFQRMDMGKALGAPSQYEFETIPLSDRSPQSHWPHAAMPIWPTGADIGPDIGLDAIAAAFCAEALAATPKPAPEWNDVARLAGVLAAGHDSDQTAHDLWRSALNAHPGHLAELTLLGNLGLHLGRALAGDLVASSLLPANSTLDHLLDASPLVAVGHDAIAAALAQLVSHWPDSQRLRVIEVGGGAPDLTARLMALLPAGRYDYTIAAADAALALTAEAGLGHQHPDHSVVTFDAARPLADQEQLAVGSHDLVIAVNALGYWPDASTALAALASLGRGGARVLSCAPAAGAWLDLAAAVHAVAGKAFPLRPLPSDAFGGFDTASAVTVAGTALLAASLPAAALAANTGPLLAEDARPWLILAGGTDAEMALADVVADRLGAALIVLPEGEGDDETALRIPADSPAAWADFLATLVEAGSEPAGLIHLWGLAEPRQGRDGDLSHQNRRCWSTLAFAQATTQVSLSQSPHLVTVTRGALDGEISQAPLWGLARVLGNEFPQLSVRRIDLDPMAFAGLGAALAAEIAAPDAQDEVRLGLDWRQGLRLRKRAVKPVGASASAPAALARTLSFGAGSLDHLAWVDASRRAPGAGEVEIRIRASGLNFRDVMLALGVLPDEAVENGFAGANVGMEAAGTVVAVGAGVDRLSVGDDVLFFAPACFASHVTTKVTAVARKPASLGFAEAATIPTAFFTIYYALSELARLRAGERVLIHGAAGGVGLAAIQYARHVGAEIFATAGSPEKRAVVELAGVPRDHILDSRSLAFADQVMTLTQGQGVDVVLNSLAGEAIHKSLGLLRPFGRFLELGKRDFFANTPLGLRPFRNNISYFGIDADQLMAVLPDLAGRLFAQMMELFEQGIFHPLPYRVFPQDRIVDAFRHMQQSRHMGKIIVADDGVDDLVASVPADGGQSLTLDPDGAYLVTGGLGGFGLATAQWLAERGARHLVLASRRGKADDDAQAVLDALAAQGVEIQARACDVGDAAQVDELIQSIAARRPLKGIIHAAAVFDDGIAATMTHDQFNRVLSPKLEGGWHLHRASLGQPLDLFVLYSSVTTILGNPGQANYVAGNMALEALAHHRRARSLPALAVGWGAIADAGYLTRHTDVRDTLSKRMGVDALTARTALDSLGALLAGDHPPVVCVAEVDWRTMAALPALKSPRFALVASGGRTESSGEAFDLDKLLAGLSPQEVTQVLTELVAEQVGTVLRIPAERLDVTQSVFEMGMDSLMAMELRSAIEERFGVQLPAMALSEGASITRLAERIRAHLMGDAKADAAQDDVTALLARHAEGADKAVVAQGVAALAGTADK